MTTLVGGVGELFQGDLDLGRQAAEALAAVPLEDAVVEDLYYGALAVAQRLAELGPTALILVGTGQRGLAPGSITRKRVHHRPSIAEVAQAMAEAGTGYVGIDLILDVAAGLGALPERTIVFEVEPASVAPGEGLSPVVSAALQQLVGLISVEARRLPLLAVADRIRERASRLGEAPAVEEMSRLLEALTTLDQSGRWAGAFSLRDRLRLQIAAGQTPEDMEHLDWALWWGLIEELDRLEAAEAIGASLPSAI